MAWKKAQGILCTLLLLGLGLLAGCTSPSGEREVPEPINPEPEGNPTENGTQQDLYDFCDIIDGFMVGAQPSNFGQPGPADQTLPSAREDRFTVPLDNMTLKIQWDFGGTGELRVEVYDPSGELFYASGSNVAVGTSTRVVPVRGTLINETEKSGPAGEYTIRFRVAGVVHACASVVGFTGDARPEEEHHH